MREKLFCISGHGSTLNTDTENAEEPQSPYDIFIKNEAHNFFHMSLEDAGQCCFSLLDKWNFDGIPRKKNLLSAILSGLKTSKRLSKQQLFILALKILSYLRFLFQWLLKQKLKPASTQFFQKKKHRYKFKHDLIRTSHQLLLETASSIDRVTCFTINFVIEKRGVLVCPIILSNMDTPKSSWLLTNKRQTQRREKLLFLRKHI